MHKKVSAQSSRTIVAASDKRPAQRTKRSRTQRNATQSNGLQRNPMQERRKANGTKRKEKRRKKRSCNCRRARLSIVYGRARRSQRQKYARDDTKRHANDPKDAKVGFVCAPLLLLALLATTDERRKRRRQRRLRLRRPNAISRSCNLSVISFGQVFVCRRSLARSLVRSNGAAADSNAEIDPLPFAARRSHHVRRPCHVLRGLHDKCTTSRTSARTTRVRGAVRGVRSARGNEKWAL